MQMTNDATGAILTNKIAKQGAIGKTGDRLKRVARSWGLFCRRVFVLDAPLQFLKGQLFVIYMHTLEQLYTLYK